MDWRKNKMVMAALLATAVTLLVGTLAFLRVFVLWELQLGDGLYHPGNASQEIVLVGVDERTLMEMGEFSRWSRSNYAQALENLALYQPAVVGFDFLLLSPRDAAGDAAFAAALGEIDAPVVLAVASDTEPADGTYLKTTEAMLPLESFVEADNSALGHIAVRPDSDEIIRKVPVSVVDTVSGKSYDSLSVAVARHFLGDGDELSIPLVDAQMLVNFQSQPWGTGAHYETVSFVDLYNNRFSSEFNPASFKDKIVLFGPTAAIFKDGFLIPLSSTAAMPGVEIHANAIQTLLDGSFLRYLSVFEKILLILVLAFGAVFVFMYTKIRWSVLFLVGVGVLYGFAAFWLFRAGVIMDMVHPYLVLILAFISTFMYRYVTEFKAKMALKSAFSKYVNVAVAEKISENPESLQLGGSKQNITVIFTDIAHFTTISEQLKPESLVGLLNEYLDAMSTVIMNEGGTVDKYEGDAIMAFFGAPIAQADHALRACRTALAMRQMLAELHAKWQKDGPLPGGEKRPLIDFRCGISSGDAIVGNIGSLQRLEYTAMGDIVNLGSRLEGANKKYSTSNLMSEETYKAVSQEVEARELDTIKVVGKQQPIKVFELLNIKGQLVPEAARLLVLYNEGMALYHERKFAEGLAKFDEILKSYPQDGPSKLYRQRCEVLRDFPPAADWDGVFEMGTK